MQRVDWFGEETQPMDESRWHVSTAAKVRAARASLTVHPATSLVKAARGRAEKVLFSLEIDRLPYGFTYLQGLATAVVSRLAEKCLNGASEGSNSAS